MTNCLSLKKSNCKNCYKCIRYCPVKSIRFSGNQAHIIGNECILCGHCFVVCPQNAKEITSEIEKVNVLIQSGSPIVVSLAPSFAANYEGVGINGMRKAIKELGFQDAEETAIGASIVKTEYDRMINEEKRDIIISSCCHSINLINQKYYPKALPYLANILSPMQAHAQDIKRRIPDAKVVFVGPCVATKDEAEYYKEYADAVLTFEELTQMFNEKNIELVPDMDDNQKSRARFFPTTGGILKTMAKDNPNYSYLAIDGVEACKVALEEIINGNVHNAFIEMSACIGSCIGGPVMEKYHRSPIKDYSSIAKYAGKEDFEVSQPDIIKLRKYFSSIEKKNLMPAEYEIQEVLKQMGKENKEDILDCGSCGYNTCREKAIAILQGKAEISMCLPYLKEKAESFSDCISSNTPNGIIVLNERFEVQQINTAARRMLSIRSLSDIIGSPVIRILDLKPFATVYETKSAIRNKRTYLAEYDKYVEQTIIYDKTYHLIVCLLRDVTEEEVARQTRDEISKNTVEIADKVVDKQMRIVQEIASLLGETAAETKIALTKLKDSIKNE